MATATAGETAGSERPATAVQLEVLAELRRSYREHGVPPSIRDLMETFGWTSPNAVVGFLRQLARRGLIRRVGTRKARCWVPAVPEGCCPCCGRRLPGR